MNVVFRADASTRIGSGHVVRCVTLAEELRRRGAAITFVCREMPGDYIDWLAARGISCESLPPAMPSSVPFQGDGIPLEQEIAQVRERLTVLGDTDWMVVDHYALDAKWETAIRGQVGRILCIDDLSNRPHDCDLLLDQNQSAHRAAYPSLVPEGCVMLLGPSFALLREDWARPRDSGDRDPDDLRILVSFGGSDPTGETLKAIEAIKACAQPGWRAEVVAGAGGKHIEAIREASEREHWINFHGQVENMPGLARSCDLAIGGGGVSALERCALGLPSLVIAVADNQVAACEALTGAGAIEYLGLSKGVSAADLQQALLNLAGKPARRDSIARCGRLLVDGKGTSRVATEIEWSSHAVRK